MNFLHCVECLQVDRDTFGRCRVEFLVPLVILDKDLPRTHGLRHTVAQQVFPRNQWCLGSGTVQYSLC